MSFVIGSENLFGETIVPFILEFSPQAHRGRFRSVDRGFCVGLVFALIVDDPMMVMFLALWEFAMSFLL